MKILTFNVNGIRSAQKKGFFDWVKKQKADVICLQELKAQYHQLQKPEFELNGYECYIHEAKKPGYSGVAIYSRKTPDKVTYGLGWNAADDEGRYVQCDFGSLRIASIYVPSGTTGERRQKIKMDFLKQYEKKLKQIKKSKHQFIICGDLNIAHTKKDLKNWRANQNHTGFLPEERAWMDQLFGALGFVDAFRVKNQKEDQYTWWSFRGRARDKNVGWRLDYQAVTPQIAKKITSVKIHKAPKMSDHAPLIISYNI